MKKILFLLIVTSIIFACTQTEGYKVTGTYKNAPQNSKVYLAELTYESINYIDSAIIKNDSFEFTGTQETPNILFLFYPIAEGGEDMIPIVLENGNIDINIGNTSTVSGSDLNNAMQSYKNDFDEISRKANKIFKSIENSEKLPANKRDSLQNIADGLIKETSDVVLRHISNNINNPIGAFLISTTGQNCNPQELYELIDSVPQIYRDERFNRFYKQFKKDILIKNGAIRTAEGGSYVNFELKDITGKPILFSSIVEANKYTLLDFWASWCTPCRNAMPEIKKIYEKYGNKGLAVVSLSLDTDEETWKKAVNDLGMSWIQLCNPNGGSQEVSQAYGIEFIPTVLIIDKTGKIVSRGLENKKLIEKIDELMK